MQGLLERCGAPVALYADRHGVFKHTPGPEISSGPTQFSRAMDELGVQMIFALSPQAKGRVERTWETFQDRLVTELRLAGATNIEEANNVLRDFLPRFNRRFRAPPHCTETAFRPLDAELCLEQVLCFKHSRRVARDNTVRFQLHTLQLLPGLERPSYAGPVVEVLEGLDRRLAVRHEGRIIPAPKRRLLVLSQLGFSICSINKPILLSCLMGNVDGGGGSDGSGQIRGAAGTGTTGRAPATDPGWQKPGKGDRQGADSPQE